MNFLIRTLIEWRRFIVSCTLIAAVAMAVVSLFLPKWYTATTTIFPPETKSGLAQYTDLIESLNIPLMGPTSLSALPISIYVDVLLSRKIGEQIVEEFNLKEAYGHTLMTDALSEFHAHSTFRVLENGILVIKFEDKDPEKAAAIANRYAELLDDFNQKASSRRASKTREFIEEQLDIRKELLRQAEEDLRSFKEKNKTLLLDEQVKSSLLVMADLTGQAIALEVELKILDQYASKSSDEYMSKKKRYDEITDQLEKLKVDSARNEDDIIRSFYPTLDKVPQVTLELLRFTRRVKIEETVYGLLVKEHEKARIEEARDTPTIQVLDVAKVPEIRSRPKRKFLVVVGGLVGFGWSALLSVLITFWRQEDKQREAIREIAGPILDDFSRVFRRKK